MDELIHTLIKDIQPGRLLESLVFLTFLLYKIKPHLKQADKRMQSIEGTVKEIKDTVTLGFAQGNARFTRIETRLDLLEQKPKTESEVSNGASNH